MAEALSMDLYDFTDEYCEVLEKRHLVLRKHPDEACVFLEEGGCRVYGARPKQCRDFPGKWDTPNSQKYCGAMREKRRGQC
jgi:Fe-S-cluster containining protein